MKKQVKILGIAFGLFAFSLVFFVSTTAKAQASVGGGDEDWICCQHPLGIGCTDNGGVFWANDIYIPGSQNSCS